MADDTEKVSINVGAMDLANIDLLIEKTVYKDRTDFFRTAARNQVDKHAYLIESSIKDYQKEDDIDALLVKCLFWIGSQTLDRQELNTIYSQAEAISKKKGESTGQVKIVVFGKLEIDKDITLSEIKDKIQSIKVFGIFRASQEIKNFYK
ncbi:hypothetical protein M3231_03775 [Neobacillus mesonae]|nr:hypothetical protein [Neobacillus mesonae]